MAASIPELTSPTNTTRNQHSTEISIYQMEHQTCNLTETFDKYLRLLHLCLLGIPLLGEPLTLSTKQLPQNKRARISNRNAPKKNEQKRGNINSLSPAGHPWIACAPRAPPACACAPRSPGAGHGASGEALCDLPAAAANSSRRKLKKNKKKKARTTRKRKDSRVLR